MCATSIEKFKGQQMFDVFITSTFKDFNKLKYTIDILKAMVSGINNIYVCSPSGDFYKEGVINVKDSEVLSFDCNR